MDRPALVAELPDGVQIGDDEVLLDDFAWHTGNTWDVGLRHSQPVATKKPNPWGLYDMHGNLWEWVRGC